MDDFSHSGCPRRAKRRVKGPTDRPPQLSPVDRIIDLHHGTSTAIEATPQRLQASKQYPIPSLPERIEQLQKQNSSLNHEIAYYREMEQYREEFQDDIVQVKERLDKAISKLGSIQRKVGYGWAQLRRGSSADVEGNFQLA